MLQAADAVLTCSKEQPSSSTKRATVSMTRCWKVSPGTATTTSGKRGGGGSAAGASRLSFAAAAAALAMASAAVRGMPTGGGMDAP